MGEVSFLRQKMGLLLSYKIQSKNQQGFKTEPIYNMRARKVKAWKYAELDGRLDCNNYQQGLNVEHRILCDMRKMMNIHLALYFQGFERC